MEQQLLLVGHGQKVIDVLHYIQVQEAQ